MPSRDRFSTGARGAGLSAWCRPVSCRTPCRTRTGAHAAPTPVQRGWDVTAPSVVRLVKGSRMEGMTSTWLAKTSSVSVVTCDGTSPSAASVALELRLPARSAQGQGSAIRSCRGRRWWRCRTGSFAGGSSVLSICGRDGEGNAPALPGPAGLPRANRHAARGRLRTRRYQAARGDPGRMNVGLVCKQVAARFGSVFDSLCRRGSWALTCTNTDVGWDLNRCS